MNKSRRKRLQWCIDELEALMGIEQEKSELLDKLDNVINELECCKDEEQESLDSLPENMQFSERADTFQENIDNLEDAYSDLETSKDYIEAEEDELVPTEVYEDDFNSAIDNINEAIER